MFSLESWSIQVNHLLLYAQTLFTVVFDDPCSVASANDVEAFAELAFGMESVFRRVFKGRDDLRELIHCKGDGMP